MTWSTPSVLPAVLILVLIFILKKLIPRYLKYRSLKIIPGPDCGFWIGQFVTIFTKPFMQPHKGWWKDIVGYNAPLLRYSKLFGETWILVLDPEIIREILMAPVSKDNSRFYKPYSSGPLTTIIGRGLVVLEGEEWMRHRRLIQPAFSVSFLKEAVDESVPNKVESFVQYWIDAGEGHEIDVSIHLSALTLDVIGEAGFSYDCHGMSEIAKWANAAKQQKNPNNGGSALASPQLTDPLITSMNALMTPSILRVIMFVFGLGKLDSHVNPKSKRVHQAMDTTIDGVIANAKQLETSKMSDKSKAKSILQLLLNAKDPETPNAKKPALTDLELRDEVKTFLFAGHETTSTWCTWAMYALAKFPDVQEKVYQDVMQHVPDKTEKLSLDKVEHMEYLAAFLQEVLRLYSPVGMTLRKTRYEETLAGYKIPKDTTLCIPAHLMHRHPKHWDNPETFSPERWLEPTVTNTGLDTRGFTFLPFGAGGHNCIGYRFATYEAKLIMAHIITKLRVEIAPSQRDVEHTFSTTVTMKAKPGLKVVVKPRKV